MLRLEMLDCCCGFGCWDFGDGGEREYRNSHEDYIVQVVKSQEKYLYIPHQKKIENIDPNSQLGYIRADNAYEAVSVERTGSRK